MAETQQHHQLYSHQFFVSLDDDLIQQLKELLLITDTFFEAEITLPYIPGINNRLAMGQYVREMSELQLIKKSRLKLLQSAMTEITEALSKHSLFPGLQLLEDTLSQLQHCVDVVLSSKKQQKITLQFDLIRISATMRGQLEFLLESHWFWASKYGGEDATSLKSLRSNPNPFSKLSDIDAKSLDAKGNSAAQADDSVGILGKAAPVIPEENRETSIEGILL